MGTGSLHALEVDTAGAVEEYKEVSDGIFFLRGLSRDQVFIYCGKTVSVQEPATTGINYRSRDLPAREPAFTDIPYREPVMGT